MECKKLINLENIDQLIQEVVNKSFRETYHHLFELDSEEEKQAHTSKEIDDLKLRAPEEKEKDLEEEEIEKEDTTTVVKKQIVPKDKSSAVDIPDSLPEVLKTSDLVKTINIIRSGKSLKDAGVLERFKQYFATLSGAEKIALKGYLDGLAQVISGGLPGTEASDPSKPPYNIEMKADKSKEKTVDTVTKTTMIDKSKKIPSGTDSPIIVGEIADKSEILNYLRNINS